MLLLILLFDFKVFTCCNFKNLGDVFVWISAVYFAFTIIQLKSINRFLKKKNKNNQSYDIITNEAIKDLDDEGFEKLKFYTFLTVKIGLLKFNVNVFFAIYFCLFAYSGYMFYKGSFSDYIILFPLVFSFLFCLIIHIARSLINNALIGIGKLTSYKNISHIKYELPIEDFFTSKNAASYTLNDYSDKNILQKIFQENGNRFSWFVFSHIVGYIALGLIILGVYYLNILGYPIIFFSLVLLWFHILIFKNIRIIKYLMFS